MGDRWVLVIGYGSTLRGDDGVGPCVADQLAQRSTLPARVMACHQLTIDLAEPVSRAGAVVLIDAARAVGQGDVPGTITRCRVVPEGDRPHSMLHHMPPGALLAAAQVLYGAAPPTTLWTITGQQFAYGNTLSPVVTQAVPDLLVQLVEYVHHIARRELCISS